MVGRGMGVADPLEDVQPEPCGCDGGWKWVTAEYARHLFPDPPPAALAELDMDAAEALLVHVEERRRAASVSVYPCRVCRSASFMRWVGRHYASDHDPASCEDCIDLLGGRSAARRVAKARHVPPAERRDLA